jgi:hypothetical protein
LERLNRYGKISPAVRTEQNEKVVIASHMRASIRKPEFFTRHESFSGIFAELVLSDLSNTAGSGSASCRFS